MRVKNKSRDTLLEMCQPPAAALCRVDHTVVVPLIFKHSFTHDVTTQGT